MDFVFSNALLFWGIFLLVRRFQGAVNLIFLRPLFFLGLLVLVVLVRNHSIILHFVWNFIGGWIKVLLIYYFGVIFRFIVLLFQQKFYEMVFFGPFNGSSPILFFLRRVILSSIFLVASCGFLAGAIFLRITVLLDLIAIFRYVDFGR